MARRATASFGPSRRSLLCGAAVALAAPVLWTGRAAAAQRFERQFDILRGGSSIGEQTTAVAIDGDAMSVFVNVRILIRILGVPVYRYELDSEERWQGHRLVALDGAADDDGRKDVARVRREDGTLISSGSFEGPLPGDAVTTTYFTQEFLRRSTWISNQTGAPLAVHARRDGSERIAGLGGEVDCARWRLDGDLPLTLYYDGRGEWMGNAFDAGGVKARFAARSETGRLAELWG